MFIVLHVSDLHYDSEQKTAGKVDSKVDIGIVSSQEKEFFEQLKKYLTDHKVNLFVISGDIINGWDREAQKKFSKDFIKLIKNYGYKESDIIVVPGNHDVKKGSPISSEERYKEFYNSWKKCKLPYLDGYKKKAQIFYNEENSLMFIPLNTSNWSQVKIIINEKIQKHIEMITDNELKKEFEKQFIYDATYVSKEQIDFLQEEIKKIENHESYTKILIQHHHLVAVDDSIEVKEMGDILNSEEIKNFIKDNNIKVLLHGHKHSEKAFYEYLNKDNESYKLLISSASNLNKNSFFQVLKFSNFNVEILKYDRKLNFIPNYFSINDALNTNYTIVIEDSNITNLYNKLIALAVDKKNVNKQFICNLDLTKHNTKEFPIPIKYPKDIKEQNAYEKDIYKHVEWWQQDSTIYDDISELHGPKLKKFQGYYNQLEYIYQKLSKENNSKTSQAIAVLIEPTKDFQNDKKYPSFISCQFIVREKDDKKFLDIYANFRKQEMRHWWALNIVELYKLLIDMKSRLGNDFQLGKIVTISNIITCAKENAFGRSYVSSIDYYMDVDPINVMHQAHSIMCNKKIISSEEELNNTEFIKLFDEIFQDFQKFVNTKNNNDGNPKPREGIEKLSEFIKKAMNDNCSYQKEFQNSLKNLAKTIANFDEETNFEKSLESFKSDLEDTIDKYDMLKKELIKNINIT